MVVLLGYAVSTRTVVIPGGGTLATQGDMVEDFLGENAVSTPDGMLGPSCGYYDNSWWWHVWLTIDLVLWKSLESGLGLTMVRCLPVGDAMASWW